MDLCYPEKRFQNLAKITKRCQPCRARLVRALYFHHRCFSWTCAVLRKQTLLVSCLIFLFSMLTNSTSCDFLSAPTYWDPGDCWTEPEMSQNSRFFWADLSVSPLLKSVAALTDLSLPIFLFGKRFEVWPVCWGSNLFALDMCAHFLGWKILSSHVCSTAETCGEK